MKHSTSSTHFSGIPIDTNTLAGQWMTFSHMANHYRKLLNVKPRVNTGLVQGNNGVQNNNYMSSSTTVMMQSSKSQKTMGSSKKRQTLSSSNSHTNNFHLYEQPNRKNSLLFSSHPDHLNTSSGKGSSRELTSKPSLKPSSTNNHNNACQPQFSDYQVVFGPSSIRSSTDAFLSDETESTMSNDNKPPSEVQAPIGVTEKIRRFLNHIHQLDLTSTSNPSSVKKKTRPKTVTTPASITTSTANGVTGSSGKAGTLVPSSASTTTANNIDFRMSRHSKCFIPWEASPPATSPRKSPRLAAKSSLRNTGDRALSASISSLNRRQGKTKLGMEQSQKSSNCDQLPLRSSEVGRNRHTSSGMDIHSMLPEKDGSSGKKPGKSRRRAGSIASIGTICGSDELTAEDFPMSIKDICSTLEGGLGLMDDDLNDQLLSRIMDDNFYLRKHSKNSSNDHHYHDLSYNRRPPITTTGSTLQKSNSMASLVPAGSGSGSGSSANNSKTKASNGVGGGGPPNGNNKDSSRDSAYGFSSGESRITTRESTPEKKCLNGEKSLKHQQKHRDTDNKPCKDLYDKERGKSASFSSEKRFHSSNSNSKVSKDHRHLRSSRRDDSPVVGLSAKTTSAHSLQRQDSSETYIALLAELTQDIVSKGIYTNKGLKALFKSYADQHKNLNQDKLADMLEHLRMDLGIPKDDALDRIEFGYGSISNATSTTYFYKPPALQERLSSDDMMSPGNNSGTTNAQHQPPSSTSNLPGNKFTSNSNHPRPPDSLQSDSPSPTTIIPTSILPEAVTPAPTTTTTTGFSSSGCPNTSSNRSTTTTEEGSGDIPSDNDTNYKHDDHDHDEEGEGDEEEDSLGVGKEDGDVEDELSLSESEVTQALKFAGLDDCTMEELVGILKS